jgi:hypothetical protein
MHKLKITVTEPQAREALETLYKKNPFISSFVVNFPSSTKVTCAIADRWPRLPEMRDVLGHRATRWHVF